MSMMMSPSRPMLDTGTLCRCILKDTITCMGGQEGRGGTFAFILLLSPKFYKMVLNTVRQVSIA